MNADFEGFSNSVGMENNHKTGEKHKEQSQSQNNTATMGRTKLWMIPAVLVFPMLCN